MKIAIAGASGFVGKILSDYFKKNGDEILSITRNPRSASDVYWNPDCGNLDAQKLNATTAIINLAGENIFKRWNKKNKESILQSRINSVQTLANAISQLGAKPKCFICASAVGFYGVEQKSICDEFAPKGDGFLSDVCDAWENQTKEIANQNVRTVNARLAIVLDSRGGYLQQLLKLAKFKITLDFSNAENSLPWIDAQTLARATEFCIKNESISGAVNFANPNSTSLQEINKAIKHKCNTLLNISLPRCFAKLALGEMGETFANSNIRVSPKKLLQNGFEFEGKDATNFV